MTGAESTDGSVAAEERRSFDRLVNFTDAVVAIAITLQLLPLAAIDGPSGDETIFDVFSANAGSIMAFGLSFVIVIVMWINHNKIFNVLRRYDGTILWLNIGWLVSIAFLPWPTAMYGNAASSEAVGPGGVALVYWVNLAIISVFVTLIARHARLHPDLLEPGAAGRGWLASAGRARLRGYVFPAYFLVIGLACEFISVQASWLALGLIPIGRWLAGGSPGASSANDRQPNETPPTGTPPS
jgi:uncharacterized membrane protein